MQNPGLLSYYTRQKHEPDEGEPFTEFLGIIEDVSKPGDYVRKVVVDLMKADKTAWPLPETCTLLAETTARRIRSKP